MKHSKEMWLFIVALFLVFAISIRSELKQGYKEAIRKGIEQNNNKQIVENSTMANELNIVNKNFELNEVKIEEEQGQAQIQNLELLESWELVLVNFENVLPEDFDIEIAKIDGTREFDKRAIDYLLNMIKDMKSAGVKDIWVQSSYRSVKRQTELLDQKIQLYMSQGKNREESEKLALKLINKPGTSEHNLGLAVDFNYINYEFDKSPAYTWLLENAENYGFILRYRKDKSDITKINYEPWHWRYVGIENAKRINELDMCLEEYVEYLKNNTL